MDAVSIAAVAESTGIGVETLRAWERRYGRPQPVRLPSGHRRFTPEQVEWLHRVADAVALGHRPASVLTKSAAELDALLRENAVAISAASAELQPLLSLARDFADRELFAALESDARERGLRAFVLDRVVPLLRAVGEEWRAGTFQVRHEHLLSEVIEDVLRARLRDEPLETRAPTVLLATISGERHRFGLLAAASILTSARLRCVNLGIEVPNDEVLAAARELDATALALSVSLATCGVETERQLAELRAGLPPDVIVIAGGQGAKRLRRGVRGVEYFPDLAEFDAWLRAGSLAARGGEDRQKDQKLER